MHQEASVASTDVAMPAGRAKKEVLRVNSSHSSGVSLEVVVGRGLLQVLRIGLDG